MDQYYSFSEHTGEKCIECKRSDKPLVMRYGLWFCLLDAPEEAQQSVQWTANAVCLHGVNLYYHVCATCGNFENRRR